MKYDPLSKNLSGIVNIIAAIILDYPKTGVGFYFESAGGRGNILIVTELFYQICFVKLKMFLWKDLSHFFSLASLTKCRHESA